MRGVFASMLSASGRPKWVKVYVLAIIPMIIVIMIAVVFFIKAHLL